MELPALNQLEKIYPDSDTGAIAIRKLIKNQNLITVGIEEAELIQGIQGEKGEQGEQGSSGIDGKTPFIGENGNWWIGVTDTGVSANTAISVEELTQQIKDLNGSHTSLQTQITTINAYKAFENKNLNTTNIDTIRGNYVTGTSTGDNATLGVRPFSGWNNIAQFDCSHFISQLGFGLTGGKLAFRSRYSTDAYSKWKEIATTEKISFNCTANTGYTIIEQLCYTLNGEFFITLRVKKTDGTAFGTSDNIVCTNPYSTQKAIVGSAIARVDPGAWNLQANTYQTTNNIRVNTTNTSVNDVYITIRGGIS